MKRNHIEGIAYMALAVAAFVIIVVVFHPVFAFIGRFVR